MRYYNAKSMGNTKKKLRKFEKLKTYLLCNGLILFGTMASADFLVYRNTESSPRPPLVRQMSFHLTPQNLHDYPFGNRRALQ